MTNTAPMGLPRRANLNTGCNMPPKSLSFAKASSTREAPIRLLNEADRVAAKIPIATNGGQKLMYCMYK